MKPDDRIELHPGCDLWMRGARFGVITRVRGEVASVKLDKYSRVIRVPADRLTVLA